MNTQPLEASSARLQTLAPWAGIVFAVLLVAGFILVGDTPDSTDRQAWLDFHDDSGNRVQQIVGAYLGILSAFAFLWFGLAVVARLSGSRGGGDVLTGLARSAATLFAVLLLLAMITQVSISAAVEIGDVAAPETADLGIQFEQLAFGILLVAGCMSAALYIAAVSELARQRRVWPSWLTWAGFVAAVLLLFGALFFPLVLVPLWALAASVVMLMRATPPTALT